MAVLKNIGELLQLKEVKTLEDHRMTAKIVEIYSKAFVNLTRVTGALRGDNTSMSPSQATQQTQTNIQITLPPKQDLPIEEGHITVSEIYSDDSKESEENA